MHIIVLKVASICFFPYVAYSNKVTMFKHFIGHRQIKPEIFLEPLVAFTEQVLHKNSYMRFQFCSVSYRFS